MKHTALRLLLLTALCLPGVATAQPDRGPGPRGEGDAPPPERRERGDRPERGERGADDNRWKDVEPIPVDKVDDAMATIRELHPGATWLGRIDELIQEDREEAAKHLARFPRILELIETRAERPDEFALHVKSGALMRELFPMIREYRMAKRDGDQATMDALRPKIREKTEAVFDVRIEIEQMKIERMKRELVEAEKEVDQIIAGKEEEIDKRMHDMLDREWDRRRRGGEGEGEDRRREREDADKPEAP